MYAIYGNIYHQYTPNVSIYNAYIPYMASYGLCESSVAPPLLSLLKVFDACSKDIRAFTGVGISLPHWKVQWSTAQVLRLRIDI
jgi:hypothetical protein